MILLELAQFIMPYLKRTGDESPYYEPVYNPRFRNPPQNRINLRHNRESPQQPPKSHDAGPPIDIAYRWRKE